MKWDKDLYVKNIGEMLDAQKSFILKHIDEIKKDPMFKPFMVTSKVINYHQRQNRIVRDNEYGEYELSIVSGRTDVPAHENMGYFEVAIIKIEDKDTLGEDEEILILGTVCDFEEVYKIQKKFREDPRKLWSKAHKKWYVRRK